MANSSYTLNAKTAVGDEIFYQSQLQIGCESAKWGSFAIDPSDATCQSYFWCLNQPLPLKCPAGLKFDPRFSVCNWSFLTPCVLDQPDAPQPTTVQATTTTTSPSTTASTTVKTPPPKGTEQTSQPTSKTSSTTSTTRTTTTTTTTSTMTTTPPTNQGLGIFLWKILNCPDTKVLPLGFVNRVRLKGQANTVGTGEAAGVAGLFHIVPQAAYGTPHWIFNLGFLLRDINPCLLPGAQTFHADKTDCSAYIMCVHGRSLRRVCSAGLVWNQQGARCDWPANVDCDNRKSPGNGDNDESGGDVSTSASPVEAKTSGPGGAGDPSDSITGTPGDENREVTDASPSEITRSPPTNGNSSGVGDCRRIVCYFTNWAQYRPVGGKFVPENIDANHCTHIIYAFAKLNGNRLAAFEWNDDSTPYMTGMYARVMKLKRTNPELKVMLAVGGWNMGSFPFTQMVATQSNRKEFIDTGIQFLRERNFDGLDLDWEYPANRGSPRGDRSRFSLLLKELREAYENEARLTDSPRLLLAAAVSAGKTTIDSAYEIPELAKYLDFANLMSYDLHGAWDAVTGHNSPLYPGPWEFRTERYLNVDWAARYWVQRGFPRENLVVGVPFYGRTFTLAGSNSNVKAPARGAGTAGRFTRERGFVSYYEVCEYLREANTESKRLEPMRVPYLVRKGNEWIGYDDSQSLTTKVEYIVQNSYGGVMIWSIAMDDFQGQFCGQGNYPLMNTIRRSCGVN